MADHKLREDVENMKNILFDLREWRKTFDSQGSPDEVRATIASLRQELDALKASVTPREERNGTQEGLGLGVAVSFTPTPRSPHSPRAGNSPRSSVVNVENKPSLHKQPRQDKTGMSPEQQQEFKKQQLFVNALQDRIKDLESKMVAAQDRIMFEGQRIEDLAEREEIVDNDLSTAIDKIEFTLSEKVANQREEVKKIAGDIPEPINYDPFNYGEAFKGETVDFEARQRCFQLKLLLHGLQRSLDLLKNSITVSNSIDLGYQVVRMDQLLHGTGFGNMETSDEADEVMLIEQIKTRQPGLQTFPKTEMFQTDQEGKRKWSITNTIMQTMYRLETELAALQRSSGLSDVSNSHKALKDIQSEMKSLKTLKLEEKDVQKILSKLKHGAESASMERDKRIPKTDEFVSKETFTKVVHNLNNSVDKLLKHFKGLESSLTGPSSSAAIKQKYTNARQGITQKNTDARQKAKMSCLSCNGAISGCTTEGVTTNIPVMPKLSPKAKHDRIKYQYWFNRAFTVGMNGMSEEFHVPGMYESSALLAKQTNLNKTDFLETKQQAKCEKHPHYIRGTDGKLYFAEKRIEIKETENAKTNNDKL